MALHIGRVRAGWRGLVVAGSCFILPAVIIVGVVAAVYVRVAFLFGSGYVLLAFLRADLVNRLHWFTEQQLLDAVAIGQFTPGPVFTTATFIGYVLAGTPGALVATTASFLPAFVYVAVSGPLVPRLRSSPTAAGVLDGVNIASVALMTGVTWQIGRAAIIDVTTGVLAVAASAALLTLRINPAWLMAAGGLIGIAATRF